MSEREAQRRQVEDALMHWLRSADVSCPHCDSTARPELNAYDATSTPIVLYFSCSCCARTFQIRQP